MDIRFATKRLPPQRYSITQLLQLAAGSQNSFDLSKFTYDAARAGVIPQLGDIAMPIRQPSGQRAPKWSSESFDPAIGLTIIGGNGVRQRPVVHSSDQSTTALEEPRRQPSGPPVVSKAQNDAGFARFLKKHTSPTHNRVTAGGRIVPMEKRDSPPKFDLAAAQNLAPVFRDAVKSHYLTSNRPSEGLAREGEDGLGYNNVHTSMLGRDDDIAMAAESEQAVPGDGQTSVPASPDPSQATVQLSQTALGNSYASDQLNTGFAYSIIPQTTLSAFSPVVPVGWQYPSVISTTGLGQDVFDGLEPTTRLLVSSQNCLAQAELHFSNLDRQLKAIDRHRAMSHHDPNLAAQRYAIVEKRSEAKELVSRLVAQVDALQSLKGPLVDSLGSSGLMASAQPFVPQHAAPMSSTSSRPPTAGGSVDLSIDPDRSFIDKQPISTKRKIIPIVAPPPTPTKLSSNNASRCLNAGISRESHGEASKQHARELQGAVSQSAVRQRAPSRFKSDGEPPFAAKYAATTACLQSSTDSEEPYMIRYVDGKPGPLPHGMEALTESYYDALRLPEGVTTVFMLDDDMCFEVRGIRLLRPSSTDMSAIERAYWDKKPVMDRTLLDELRSKAEIINESDYGDDCLLGHTQTRAIDLADDAEDDGSIHSDEGGVQLQTTDNMQTLLEAAIKVEAGSRHLAASAPQPTAPVSTSDENQTDPAVELNNKGYSSVSVQNINATVRLPPSFNGTTENKSRNAKAVLAAANKTRGPHVLHRSSLGA